MDTTTTATTPALLQLQDTGQHLLYPGKINMLFGGPGTGKSHVAFVLLHQQALAGHTTLVLDYEKNATTFALRAGEHQIPSHLHDHLAYWRPKRPLADIQPTVLQYARTHDVSTIVIDGVGQALAHAYVDESDNSGVAAWFETSVEPLTDAGLTVLLIDHSGHAHSVPGRTPHPVGASAKLRYTTGTLLYLAPARPFSKHTAGHALVCCVKDNAGEFTVGQPLAEFHVTPTCRGTEFRLTAPTSEDDLAERVLTLVVEHTQQHGRGPSKNQIRGALGYSDEAREAAIKELIGTKRIVLTIDGNAHRLTAVVAP